MAGLDSRVCIAGLVSRVCPRGTKYSAVNRLGGGGGGGDHSLGGPSTA